MLIPARRYDFARGMVDPQLLHARTSVAWHVDAAGVLKLSPANTPRRTHDPDTLLPLGYWHEGPSTGLLSVPSQFNNAGWTKTEMTATADAVIAPNGSVSADKLVPSVNNLAHVTYQDAAIGSGNTTTFSVFAQFAGYSQIKLRIGNTTDVDYMEATFFLLTGVATPVTVAGAAVANGTLPVEMKYYRRYGFWRCRVTGAINGGWTTARCKIYVLDGNGNEAFVGDGASGVYLWHGNAHNDPRWGSPLENAAGANLARTADSLNTTDLGYLNTSEFTLVARVRALLRTDALQRYITLHDGSQANRVGLAVNSASTPNATGFVASAQIFSLTTGGIALAVDQELIMALRVRVNDFAFAVGSGAGALPSLQKATAGAMITGLTTLEVGARFGSTEPCYSPISRLDVYNAGLSDQDLLNLVAF